MTPPPSSEADAMVEAALDALDAPALRGLLRALIPGLEDAPRAQLKSAIVERAARAPSGWAPAAPSDRRVAEIEAFVATARRAHRADPRVVDAHLQEGVHAFLARDYAAAQRILRALLLPIAEGDLDLGHDELVDEVLGVDVGGCATQYVVATYMTAPPTGRARAVCAAIDEVQSIGTFWLPLREIERAAPAPLPGFDDFLLQWQALVEARIAADQPSDWDRTNDRWLREVVGRTEGPAGLAALARRHRRSDDLRAWCAAVAEAGDWLAARAAYEEAAALAADGAHVRGELLDGAALAAEQLGADDLEAALGRAWRAAPTLPRLHRWLGGCTTAASLRARAGEALALIPTEAARQRALLHLLRGELEAAAALLAEAPGLGWTGAEHPGPLVFPLFAALLSGAKPTLELPRDLTDPSPPTAEGQPALRTPTLDALLQVAGLRPPADPARAAPLIEAMRTAATRRIDGVTANARRHHYAHAAALAVQCARADGSPAGVAWLRALQLTYRRYPSLSRAFEAAGA